ncbi:DUF551 domain-containing protein [Raoultella ornithinolytica]|uniref:DUF551 domain-containing protein n=1 Tax=Raoultella ornithinolytica TaxID=54291 RepID=UPI0038909767
MTSKLTITRERMQEIAEDGFLKHGESKELARMALSAMDCEPVAYIDKQWTLVYYVPPMSMGLKIGDKLYRHAQPAPVVMDDRKLRALFDSWFASDCSFDRSPEASEADNIAWRESYWYVWQHCRAAMLQAGNSPVIPDGYRLQPISEYEAMCATVNSDEWPQRWIPVSERMPERGDYLVTDGRDFDVQSFDGEQFIPGFVWEDAITHWMPLPAAPQEVK